MYFMKVSKPNPQHCFWGFSRVAVKIYCEILLQLNCE